MSIPSLFSNVKWRQKTKYRRVRLNVKFAPTYHCYPVDPPTNHRGLQNHPIYCRQQLSAKQRSDSSWGFGRLSVSRHHCIFGTWSGQHQTREWCSCWKRALDTNIWVKFIKKSEKRILWNSVITNKPWSQISKNKTIYGWIIAPWIR